MREREAERGLGAHRGPGEDRPDVEERRTRDHAVIILRIAHRLDQPLAAARGVASRAPAFGGRPQAVIRTRSPTRKTLPSTTASTFNSREIADNDFVVAL